MEYVDGRDEGAITSWRSQLSDTARAKFRVRLAMLEAEKMWQDPYFKRLTNRSKLGEIRFKADNLQYRVIGFFGPATAQFTMLIGCTHKQQRYKPPACLDSAATRLSEIQEKRGRYREYRS